MVSAYPVSVKDFLIYSALRLLLFIAVLVVVIGFWILAFGSDTTILWPVLLAFLISGGLSIFVLNRPREALAQRVESRANRAASKFQEIRSKED
jgi:hypothetical protein